jgi:hypothetical protein
LHWVHQYHHCEVAVNLDPASLACGFGRGERPRQAHQCTGWNLARLEDRNIRRLKQRTHEVFKDE